MQIHRLCFYSWSKNRTKVNSKTGLRFQDPFFFHPSQQQQSCCYHQSEMTPDPRHRLVPTRNAPLNLQPPTSSFSEPPLRCSPQEVSHITTSLLESERARGEPAKDSGDGRELFPSPVLPQKAGDTVPPPDLLPSTVILAQEAESAPACAQTSWCPACSHVQGWAPMHVHRGGKETHGNTS